nr:GXWXG domain-containing protein [Leptothoe kymatousa]
MIQDFQEKITYHEILHGYLAMSQGNHKGVPLPNIRITDFTFANRISWNNTVLDSSHQSTTMETPETCQTILQAGKTTTEKALQLFDSLAPVNLDFMLGRWQGSGLHTSHPMDGMLEASNWYGKEFIEPEIVYPLFF